MRQLTVGLIVPSSNTVVEAEFRRLLSQLPSVQVLVTRVEVTQIGLDSHAAGQFALDRMVAAGRLLADAAVDVLVWAGTAGSWLGLDHDLRMVQALETATGIPATTSTLAMVEACRVYGVSRVFVVTPYLGEVVEKITETLTGAGLEVTGERHCGLSENRSFAAVPAAELESMITAAADDVQAGGALEVGEAAQAVLVVCTNLRALPLVEALERTTGTLIVDSVAATLWGAARRTGTLLRHHDSGALLRDGGWRAALYDSCDQLLRATAADRVTVRITEPELGLDVGLPAAEARSAHAHSAGVRSIRWDPSLDQRALETVRWIEEHRVPLVQPDFAGPPHPPDALRRVYGVRAQMLGPLPGRGPVPGAEPVRGWLSVHSVDERSWSPSDQQALAVAVAQTTELLDAELRDAVVRRKGR